MNPNEKLFDSSTIIDYLKCNENTVEKFDAYISHYNLYIPSIVFYELERGFETNTKKINIWKTILDLSVIIPFDKSIAEKSAEIYKALKRESNLLMDADIIISATALEHNLILVTSNEKHFKRVSKLKIENWQK